MTNVWLQPMTASEVMTRNVFTVDPETPTRAVAKLLLDKGISAVPVVDANGAPIGMASESDLVRRAIGQRARVRWFEFSAEGEDLAKEFIDYLKAGDRPVRDIMTAPVVTITDYPGHARSNHRRETGSAPHQTGSCVARWADCRNCEPCRSGSRAGADTASVA
jgi:CBS-domain-containing membrane protein